MTFGEKVRYLRERMELSQLELAERIGCGASTISRYELGIYNSPRKSLIKKLANTLDTTEYYLTNDNEVKTTCHDRRYEQAKTLGNLIKNYRRINRLDQKELAALLDLDQPTMSRVETGNVYILDADNEDLKNKLIVLFPDIEKDITRILNEDVEEEGEVVMEKDKETFGKRVESLRNQKGWSIRELANKCGLAKSTVYQYEIGTNFPRDKAVIALAKAFGITEQELMSNVAPHEYVWKHTDVGAIITKYRLAGEMTQKTLAENVGCNYNKIARLESGQYDLFSSIYSNIRIKLFKMFPGLQEEVINLVNIKNSDTIVVEQPALTFEGETLGERLKELREYKGLTNIQFAKLVGKSSPALYCYETDQRLPDRDTLDIITKACKISTDEILKGLNLELVKSHRHRARSIDRSNSKQYQYSALGDILREYRVKTDMSQVTLAKAIGTSHNYIYKFESGQINLLDPKYHGTKVKIFDLVPGLEKAIHEFIHKENPANKILGDSVKLELNKISQQRLDIKEASDNMSNTMAEVALDKNKPSAIDAMKERTKSIMEGRYTDKMLSGFEKNYPENKSPKEKLEEAAKNIPDELKNWPVDKLPDTIDVLFGDCKGAISLKKIKEETIKKFVANKIIDGVLYNTDGEHVRRYTSIDAIGKYENIINEMQKRIDGLEATVKEKDLLIKNEACNMDEYLSKRKSFIDVITGPPKPSDVDDDLDTTDDSEELESLISHQDIFEGIDNDVKGNIKILIFDYIYNKLLNIISKNELIKGKDVVRILDQEIKWYTEFIGDDILKTKFDNLKNNLL